MVTDATFWLVVFATVPTYWVLRERRRLPFLAAVSYIFLLSLDVQSVIALSAFGLAFYYLSPWARDGGLAARATSLLIVSIVGYLAYFKYLPRFTALFSDDPVLGKIVIPLGISYFTFKLIHYAIEVGRNRIAPHGLGDFACYLFLFPIYTAGPIEQFDHFMQNREKRWSAQSTSEGLIRVGQGLVKKFILANGVLLPLFGSVTDVSILLDRLAELPVYKVWGFFVLSFLYLYLDFSAYSDIAIGTSRLYGLRIVENFNWPILATDIGVFWKRWHMSLAGWCQRYIYLPLIGATRNPYMAGYATFLTMGLWHSGSIGWISWGLWHATGVAVFVRWTQFRRRQKWKGFSAPMLRWAGCAITMAFVSVGGVFSNVGEHAGAFEMVRVLAKLIGVNL